MGAIPQKVCWSSLSTASWRQLGDALLLEIYRLFHTKQVYVRTWKIIWKRGYVWFCVKVYKQDILHEEIYKLHHHTYLPIFFLTNWTISLRVFFFRTINDNPSICFHEGVDKIFQHSLECQSSLLSPTKDKL